MRHLHADLCVIGAGSGGLSVAAGAAQLGLDVVLIEKGAMGGDCLNTGCVPSKSFLAAAKRAQAHRLSNIAGIEAHEPSIDFARVKDHVQHVIDTIAPHDSIERFEGLGVRVVNDTAAFVDRQTVMVSDITIKAKHFVIATGSTASIPEIAGLDSGQVLTHETLFKLREAPNHLVIIGGGPIGIEMAQAHRRLGVPVTVIERQTILQGHDAEHAQKLKTSLMNEGVNFYDQAEIVEVNHEPNAVTVTTKMAGEAHKIKGSHVLIATGRRPNTQGLNLEAAGVSYGPEGIHVNAHLKTTNKKIFAIGDVLGGPLFTHAAGYQAGVVIKQACFKMRWAKANYQALPSVTYTDPEIAQVGLTEAQARDKFSRGVRVVSWSMENNDRAVAEANTQGEIKVITDPKGKILGASLIGPMAGELLSPWTLAISQGLKISAMAQVIAPYPTFSEVSKRVAGAWYTPSLFSEKTKRFVRWLSKLPI